MNVPVNLPHLKVYWHIQLEAIPGIRHPRFEFNSKPGVTFMGKAS